MKQWLLIHACGIKFVSYTCAINREYMLDSIIVNSVQTRRFISRKDRDFEFCLIKFWCWFLTAKAIFENIVVSTSNPPEITGGSLWPRGTLHIPESENIRMQSLLGIEGEEESFAGGRRRPVYNKAQYPRISLSCIFNDFLGDSGRSL